ncbi:hypothetical protein DCC85_15080 [Paenibacillus sp. CAA11]|uniref:AAA family ATPase n=1 Tax=Paenibacillus sp. CAA11 TaxID=1532905 RepID=UPI000D34D9A5|nr:SbcC/MukB-like Walker B domain-containing protein [Paenibacillus sp. CAA11]AWB45412.1 hypothetical protein DCC85_15080 [Paenibacillus sp. CAA11]
MKPIHLKLSGLQSYREAQEIDFTELCETGLFGIFGPTGSGKSTLLDAITLSLYGKVERAYGGTQGIMNHSEDSLFVSFTFELMSAAGVERYRVERRFKRTGDHSVSNTISRFIAVKPEGEEVLADKLAEVTRCVEDKIGLKMDDFTRAVVLPQGKFAEFLALKGSERRQMLQRLFHLEKYGDLLGQKLSRRVKETEGRLKELAAEQQGLGSASEEALQAAEERMQDAVKQAAAARLELQAAQTAAEELGRLRELVLQQRQLAAEEAQLQQRSPDIAAEESRLKQAMAAEAMRPALTAWKAAAQVAAEREAAAQRAAAAAEASAAQAQRAADAALLAESVLTAEEPGLLRRLEHLEQAKQLQVELKALQQEQAAHAASHAGGQKRRQELAAEAAKEEQLLAKAMHRRQELEAKLKSCEVKAADRRRLQDAVARKDALTAQEQQLQLALKEEQAQQERSLSSHALAEKLSRQEAELASSQQHMLDTALTAGMRLRQLDADLLQLLEQLELKEAGLREQMAASERHIWSVKLAEQLQTGEACPVCGSVHHPAPAASLPHEAGLADTELGQLNNLLPELRELRYEAARGAEAVRGLAEALGKNADLEAVSSEAEAAAAQERHLPIAGDAPLAIAEARGRVTGIQQALKVSGTALAQLQREVKQYQDRRDAWRQESAAAAAERRSVSQQSELMTRKREAVQQEYEAKIQEWEELFPNLSLEAAALEFEKLHAMDTEAEDVRSRLELSVPFIEEKNAKLRSLQEEMAELDRELVQWATRLEGGDKLLQEKLQRLETITSGRSAEQLFAEASDKLDALRKEAKGTRDRQREADTARQETMQAALLARQAAHTAAEQTEQLLERWQAELEQSPFTSEEDASAALLEKGVMEAMELRIGQHRDAEQELRIRLREITARLEGRTVSEEEWSLIQQQLQVCKLRDEVALEGKAKAERDWEDIKVRHLRWKELETVRAELDHQSGLLAKLQSSLRGNAFVEYVAEEQLMSVSHAASQRLRSLTKQRYSLETDSGGGFVICDDANGGIKRPVSTLSGGETFLTSLALALALSAQIQLRGQYPLQFFFLDEGFGTLDPDLLDTVITSLEHLHHDHLAVGVISHVAELRARLPRKLVVIPAESAGQGSRVELEKL